MPTLKKSTKQQVRPSFAKYPLRKWRAFACCNTLLLLLMLCHPANAKVIYVNNVNGSDANSGLTSALPLKTIAQAVRLVKPGDIVHLTNTGIEYKESLVLHNVSGTATAPITFDGHGATLSGSEPLNMQEWEEVSPGLYRNNIFFTARKFDVDWMRIYFFLFDGKMNRMGRSRKGPCAPLKAPAALGNNEWTFVESEKAFYLKIDPAKKLSDCRIEQPVRSNAVAVSGSTSYITVKNLIVTHVFNDGFGLTGTPKKLFFKNVQSHYCGDDGISAHMESQFDVEDFVSIGNATGIADSGSSFTTYNRVVIKDCVGMDLYFVQERPDRAEHSIKNVVVIGNADRPVVLLTIKPEASMKVTMENVVVLPNKERHTTIHITGNTQFYTKDCTFAGMQLEGTTQPVSLANTIIDGGQAKATGASIKKMMVKNDPMNDLFRQALKK